MHLFKRGQMEVRARRRTRTVTQRGAVQKRENTQFSRRVCAHHHLVKNVHTPILFFFFFLSGM